jgi:hypothetical protein
MKSSPIQLLESFPEKVWVERNKLEYALKNGESVFDRIDLQILKSIEAFPDYWEDTPPVSGLKDRTFRVTLGVRTPENTKVGAYVFEFVVTGTIACIPDNLGVRSPEDISFEYGLAILYGMIREQFASITSRMQPGIRLLPTVSFIGEWKDEMSENAAIKAKNNTEKSN